MTEVNFLQVGPTLAQLGDIWADDDSRSAGRQIEITGFWSKPDRTDSGKQVHYALGKVVSLRRINYGPSPSIVKIKVDRLKPGSRGYHLIFRPSLEEALTKKEEGERRT